MKPLAKVLRPEHMQNIETGRKKQDNILSACVQFSMSVPEHSGVVRKACVRVRVIYASGVETKRRKEKNS